MNFTIFDLHKDFGHNAKIRHISSNANEVVLTDVKTVPPKAKPAFYILSDE